MSNIDDRIIYELMDSLNQLKREIKDLKEEIRDLKKAVKENTDFHSL